MKTEKKYGTENEEEEDKGGEMKCKTDKKRKKIKIWTAKR